MWVHVREWVLVESDRPRPNAGSLLQAAGVRVRGVVTFAGDARPEGVAEVVDRIPPDRMPPVYSVTGTVGDAQDVSTNSKRRGRGSHSGAEFVLTVGKDRFQVQFDGHAADVTTGSRVTVTGPLELVGDYEWDAFELTDTRADWHVVKLVDLPGGDFAVELTHPPAL